MEIDHDRPVKIRPDCLFLGFTTSEHLGDLRIAKLSSLYHIVSLIYTDSCRIIQADIKIIPAILDGPVITAGFGKLTLHRNRPKITRWADVNEIARRTLSGSTSLRT